MASKVLSYRSSPGDPSTTPNWAWWRRRGTVVAIGVALWLALVFFYTWPACAMVLYRLIVEGGLLLLWLAACIGAGSVLLPLTGAMNIQSDRGVLRFVTMAALGMGAFSIIILILGLLGWLVQATAIALIAIGIFTGIVRMFATGWHPQPHTNWLNDRAAWAWLLLLIVPFIAIMTAGAMMPPGFLWTPNEPHGYDVIEYHLQVPREWFEAGRIVPLHHNVFSFFPFNVEMHYLLAMHLHGGPWAGMYLAQLMHGTMILLAVLAACGFARRMHGSAMQQRVAPVVAALAMLTTPWLAQLGAIAYDEGGFLLFGTLSLGWTARAIRQDDRRLQRFALAGVMAGLACGCKLTAVPELLVAIPVIALVVMSLSLARNVLPGFPSPQPARGQSPIPLASPGGRGGKRAPLLFGAAGLLVFAPWLIRTAVWSHGNPVFPELPSVLGHGDFNPAQIERWHHAHTAPPAEQSIAGHVMALGTELIGSWQFGYVLFPLALVSVAINWRKPEFQFLTGMLLAVLAFWLGFTHLQSRFLILLVPICALLVAGLPWSIGLAIVLQGIIGLILLNVQFMGKLHALPVGLLVGLENLDVLTLDDKVPSNVELVLVGDARAFFYQRPMSHLRYRTVFDIKSGTSGNLIDAYAGPATPGNTQYLLIDPSELERFERTYHSFPHVPPEIAAHTGPYIVNP